MAVCLLLISPPTPPPTPSPTPAPTTNCDRSESNSTDDDERVECLAQILVADKTGNCTCLTANPHTPIVSRKSFRQRHPNPKGE